MDDRVFENTGDGYNVDIMDYSGLEDLESLDLDNVYGVNAQETEVGFREDGTRIYVKDVDSFDEDIAQSHIAASIVGDHMHVLTPDIAYDHRYGKILMEEMPGEILEPGRNQYAESDFGTLYQAVAQKLLIGDIDFSGNILITEEGTASPIDYDSVGRDLITSKTTLKTTNIYDYLDADILHREASNLARRIDEEALEEDLRTEKWLKQSWCDGEEQYDPVVWHGLLEGSIENIINTIRVFQN